jgi:hypothetical protein
MVTIVKFLLIMLIYESTFVFTKALHLVSPKVSPTETR